MAELKSRKGTFQSQETICQGLIRSFGSLAAIKIVNGQTFSFRIDRK